MQAQEKLMQKFSKLLRSVLIPNKDGLLISAVEDEYHGMTGERVPYRELGYQNVFQLLQNCPQLVRIERLPDGNQIVRATADPNTDHIKNMVSKQKDNNEGFNKHTRRVINNNANYLHRSIGRREMPRPGRLLVNEGAALIRRDEEEQMGLNRRAETEEVELIRREEEIELTGRAEEGELELELNRMDETEEASRRDGGTGEKLNVTRVTAPDKIYFQTPAQVETGNNISEMLANGIFLDYEFHPTIHKLRRNGNPEPSLEVGGAYIARLYDRWHRVFVVEQTGSDKVTILLADYHIYKYSYLVINIYDLPESLDFSVIPRAVRVMSLAGLIKPANFTGWDRSVKEKLKQTLISWQDEGGVFADEHEESDSFDLYDSQGNSLSDLLNQDLLRVGDDTPSQSSQVERSGEIVSAGTARARVTLTFVRGDEGLWCHLGELAQLLQAVTAEVVEGLRQINVTLGPDNLLPLKCLPELFKKMNVENEIIIEVTSQIRNNNSRG